MGTGFFLPRVKLPGRHVDHCPASNAIKNEWSHNSASLYAIMAWTGTALPFHLDYYAYMIGVYVGGAVILPR
jgi:hypothetical protein